MIDTRVPEHEEEVGPSRTERRAQRKRTQADLDDLAERLAALPSPTLSALGLEAAVVDSVRLLARLDPGSARVRQRKFVRRQLRGRDLEALSEQVERAAGEGPRTGRQQWLERWRAHLIEGGDEAIAALLSARPDADRPRLRAVVRAAVAERAAGRTGPKFRAVYRVLADLGDPLPPLPDPPVG